MPPELLTACETVFQEHKVSSLPVKWDRDAFRGRISIGLSEMAKETLIKKNIIVLPNKSKKIITQLNPDVATAASFEEAEKIIVNKTPSLATSMTYDPDTYIAGHVYGFDNPPPVKYAQPMLPVDGNAEMAMAGIKWYMKPLFYYVVWPLCAAAAGAAISFLLDKAYSELFLSMK
jgi:hypothetical protein